MEKMIVACVGLHKSSDDDLMTFNTSELPLEAPCNNAPPNSDSEMRLTDKVSRTTGCSRSMAGFYGIRYVE